MDTLMVVLILLIEGVFNYGFFLNGYLREVANQPKNGIRVLAE